MPVHCSTKGSYWFEYEKDYDEQDHCHLWFSPGEFALIFDRDDDEFAVLFNEMQHTKQILQLWGMCSRSAPQEEKLTTMVQQLMLGQPTEATAASVNARGLESRIITGIRNHRQKAVQAFLQDYHKSQENKGDAKAEEDDMEVICPRYVKFSQTAGRFAQALAQGDALVVQQLRQEDEDAQAEREPAPQ
jgi:uncharacterized protein YdiU (UPF0061 family)